MNVEVTSVYEKITRPNNHVQADALLRRAIELLQGVPPMLLTQHDGDVRMRGALPITAQQITTDRVALQTLTATGLTMISFRCGGPGALALGGNTLL
jgi:hypothetical protein